jgi:hypothetical protein
MTRKNLMFHPVFLASLLILLFNDFYFKQAFSNGLTGKLSDFAGLIVFPIFIAHLFPNLKKWISMVAGIFFVIWKTPLVSPLIDTLNQALPFRIQRIIDYTDYWALIVLPLTHNFINKASKTSFYSTYIFKISEIGLTVITLFAICATSYLGPSEIPKGTIYIGKNYKIKKTKKEVIEAIKALGYNVDYYENLADSTATEKYPFRKLPYYQTDNIVVYDDKSTPIDTIINIKYSIYEAVPNVTDIEIINVTLTADGNVQKWQTLKYLRNQYKDMLEKHLIKKIK